MFTHPKSTFSEDHISALKGCCPLIFLHIIENALAHMTSGAGPPNNFFSVKLVDGFV